MGPFDWVGSTQEPHPLARQTHALAADAHVQVAVFLEPSHTHVLSCHSLFSVSRHHIQPTLRLKPNAQYMNCTKTTVYNSYHLTDLCDAPYIAIGIYTNYRYMHTQQNPVSVQLD